MMLTLNFSLWELTRSQVATRLDIPNVPGPVMVNRLRLLCCNILEPVREEFGSFSPSSGYRSPTLNEVIGGSKNSQHMMGEAVDFEVWGVSNLKLARWIENNLEFDQLILEYHVTRLTNSGWVHCSYCLNDRRKAVLTKIPKEAGYRVGLPVD